MREAGSGLSEPGCFLCGREEHRGREEGSLSTGSLDLLRNSPARGRLVLGCPRGQSCDGGRQNPAPHTRVISAISSKPWTPPRDSRRPDPECARGRRISRNGGWERGGQLEDKLLSSHSLDSLGLGAPEERLRAARGAGLGVGAEAWRHRPWAGLTAQASVLPRGSRSGGGPSRECEPAARTGAAWDRRRSGAAAAAPPREALGPPRPRVSHFSASRPAPPHTYGSRPVCPFSAASLG